MYTEAIHGGPVDKNPPASAGGLCCRKIPHATGLLSPVCCTAACVPRACALQQEKPPHWEAQAPQLESSPHSVQVEKSLHSKEDQRSQD